MTAFDVRRRSLARSAPFEVEVADDAEGEWVSIAQIPLGSKPRHILDVSDCLHATYYVISSSSTTGGRTLLAVRNMQLIDNAGKIVKAYEHCLSVVSSASSAGELSLEEKDKIRHLWKGVSIGLAE